MNIVERSEVLIRWIDDQTGGLETPSHLRGRIVAGCYSTVLEHQKAIVVLADREYFGSAFALARSVKEAFVRGVWFQYCASDSHIESFQKDKLNRNFGEMINDIEQLEGYSGGQLSAAKKSGWATLNSYTHTGYLQVVRRTTEDYVEPNYLPEEVDEMVDFVNGWGLLAAMELALLAVSSTIEKYLDKIKEYHSVAS